MNLDWNNIKLIVSDFDGVITDNRVLVDEMGREFVYASRADGQAVHMLRSMGMDMVIISTEKNVIVKRRSEKMGVPCIYGISNKAECLKKYCSERNVSLEHVAYVGNDINDLEAMQLSGIKIVPNDAYEEVKDIADYVTETKGGYGVIREIVGMIKKNGG